MQCQICTNRCSVFFSSPSLPSSADTSLQASGVVRDRYQIFRWRVHSSDDYNNSSWKMWVCLFVVYLCLISHWEFCNDTKVFSRKHAWCCADLIIFKAYAFWHKSQSPENYGCYFFVHTIIKKICEEVAWLYPWIVLEVSYDFHVTYIDPDRIYRLIYILKQTKISLSIWALLFSEISFGQKSRFVFTDLRWL